MPDDGTPSYWERRRVLVFLWPPLIAVWGVFSAIKREFRLGDYQASGATAVVIGLALVVGSVLLLWLLSHTHRLWNRGRYY